MQANPLTEADLPDPARFTTFHSFIKGVFSQWHATPFILDDLTFSTAEQWMMFSKARLFGDDEIAAQIIATADPGEQKRLGQRVQGFEQSLWDAEKVGVVHAGSMAKFGQNPGALRQLKATGEAMLVEANPRDWIWGVGLSVDDPRVHDPAEWRGGNLLGRILTRVREELD